VDEQKTPDQATEAQQGDGNVAQGPWANYPPDLAKLMGQAFEEEKRPEAPEWFKERILRASYMLGEGNDLIGARDHLMETAKLAIHQAVMAFGQWDREANSSWASWAATAQHFAIGIKQLHRYLVLNDYSSPE
jgi:hypothetical protein